MRSSVWAETLPNGVTAQGILRYALWRRTWLSRLDEDIRLNEPRSTSLPVSPWKNNLRFDGGRGGQAMVGTGMRLAERLNGTIVGCMADGVLRNVGWLAMEVRLLR